MTQDEADRSVPTESQRRLRHLRAMSADPARMDLFEALKVEGGPMSSAELGRRVPAARGGLQAHLRKLEEGEWVERVSGGGRQSVWQTRGGPIAWSESDVVDPDVALAVEELYWVSLQRRINRIRRFDAERQTGEWPEAWVEASIGHDYSLWLTAADLEDLEGELVSTIEKYRLRALARQREVRAAAEKPDRPRPPAELVFVTISAFPMKSTV
ncbi:helix-turn-helix domain-containing protein [Lapillicoccus sp.]|uniref:winged helix-turn-helix domain-containing protein n=1 Tax=Lapillicoccus sp. TaxID=1909287 RepID=UPI0025E6268E|nr:helix-turn-helix domain-containing protein [Lapillicoccus sp.]